MQNSMQSHRTSRTSLASHTLTQAECSGRGSDLQGPKKIMLSTAIKAQLSRATRHSGSLQGHSDICAQICLITIPTPEFQNSLCFTPLESTTILPSHIMGEKLIFPGCDGRMDSVSPQGGAGLLAYSGPYAYHSWCKS